MEICTVGGYEAVGKNMTAVKVGEDVFIFDCGLNITSMIDLQSENIQIYTETDLRRAHAIPDDLVLDRLGWRDKVRAIIIGHAHLDHVGAVPYIANRYPKAVIMGTPFTMTVLDTILQDEKLKIKNKKIKVKPNSKQTIRGKNGNYKIEFIHVTHSTLQCACLALHTKEGIFFYAVDFKFDDTPVMESPPNYNQFRNLGKRGVKALVVNSLYSGSKGRCPSESVARALLRSAIGSVKNKNSAFFITTFSSHIPRLKSIVDFGKLTNRKIIFLGRSLDKYVRAAVKVRQCPFQQRIQKVKYRGHVNSILKRIEKERGKYLVVCTGHQAEEGSILDRIVRGKTPFKFRKGDNLIFSSKVIPVPQNIFAREKMDEELKKIGVKLHEGAHVSGHCHEEDLKMLLKMLKPEHIIPTHGTHEQELPMVRIAKKLGYEFKENVHLSKDGKILKF